MDTMKNIPAFPQPIANDGHENVVSIGDIRPDCDGMTLRDYFAGKALLGRLSNPKHTRTVRTDNPKVKRQVFAKNIAEWSYQIADAMLAERDKSQPL